jgi:hypothetical protein
MRLPRRAQVAPRVAGPRPRSPARHCPHAPPRATSSRPPHSPAPRSHSVSSSTGVRIVTDRMVRSDYICVLRAGSYQYPHEGAKAGGHRTRIGSVAAVHEPHKSPGMMTADLPHRSAIPPGGWNGSYTIWSTKRTRPLGWLPLICHTRVQHRRAVGGTHPDTSVLDVGLMHSMYELYTSPSQTRGPTPKAIIQDDAPQSFPSQENPLTCLPSSSSCAST